MSTATSVPETYELEGDDALATLRHTGIARLVKDSFRRFRAADGFSHSRALAFQVTLTLLPALIATVGLATVLKVRQFTSLLRQATDHFAPGAAGGIIRNALAQGARASGDGARAALFFGLLTAVISAALAFGQIERGANRIYGVEQDRPTRQKYLTGLVLACTAGLLSVLAFVAIVIGSDIGQATGLSGALGGLWSVLRWPLAIGLIVGAMALLFRESPRRRQPAASWLAVGSSVSVLLWFLFTGLLSLYLTGSTAFGETYGPLAGMIGLLLWTFLTSLAVYLGIAFAAQLEAVRAGTPGPVTGEHENPRGGTDAARRRARPVLG
jgi:YihY family inner membrane protein